MSEVKHEEWVYVGETKLQYGKIMSNNRAICEFSYCPSEEHAALIASAPAMKARIEYLEGRIEAAAAEMRKCNYTKAQEIITLAMEIKSE